MKQVAENLWIFDGADVRFLGLNIPTRMTIAKRGSDLWIHSPVPAFPDGVSPIRCRHFEADHN